MFCQGWHRSFNSARTSGIQSNGLIGWPAKGYPVPASRADLYRKTKPPVRRRQAQQHRPGNSRSPPSSTTPGSWVEQVLDYIGDRSGWCVHLSLLRPAPAVDRPGALQSALSARRPTCSQSHGGPRGRGEPAPVSGLRHESRTHSASPGTTQAGDDGNSGYYGLMTEGRSQSRPTVRRTQGVRCMGRHTGHIHVGSRRADRRPLAVGQAGVFRRVVPRAADSCSIPRPKPRRTGVSESIRSREGVDIMSTLLDWLGLDIPEQCRGASLLPATTNGGLGEHWRSEAHWEYELQRQTRSSHRALRPTPPNNADSRSSGTKAASTGPLSGIARRVLRTWSKTPAESVNLASDPGYRSRIEEAARKLLAWTTPRDP